MDCIIRPWELKDAKNLSNLLSNKKILDNLRDGLPYPYTEENAKDFINYTTQSRENNSDYIFAITIDDKAIGSIGVAPKGNIHSQTAEMGYYISESYWGQGIGTSAIKQVCEYIFKNTNIMRVFAEPFATNGASCRILEKAGFDFEGTLRKNAVKNGVVLDMKMYAKIKE